MMSSPSRLFDFIYYQQSQFPQARAFVYRNKGNEILSLTTQEIIDFSVKVALALQFRGLKKGDKVSTVSIHNRPEWLILDLALLQLGVVNVPVYPTISAADYLYIFKEAEVQMCFIGDDAEGSLLKKVREAQKYLPFLQSVYTFDATVSDNLFWDKLWRDIPFTMADTSIFFGISDAISENDLATIIYTSGTTGEPKGVMLSHKNIVSNIKAVMHVVTMLKPGDRALSFLPLNHVFERVVSYALMYAGVNIYFTGLDNLGGEDGDIQAVKPHFFSTVPRLLEKVYEKIYSVGLVQKSWKKRIFFWALSKTNDYHYGIKYAAWRAIEIRIADKLVFSKWRAALGGNIKGILVAASACPENIIKTFCAAGIPVREGYGLTEMSPGVSFNRFDDTNAFLDRD